MALEAIWLGASVGARTHELTVKFRFQEKPARGAPVLVLEETITAKDITALRAAVAARLAELRMTEAEAELNTAFAGKVFETLT
ncbi:MAG: hypothetical protein AB7G23_03100 [Vicinamibacterales bacterium]